MGREAGVRPACDGPHLGVRLPVGGSLLTAGGEREQQKRRQVARQEGTSYTPGTNADDVPPKDSDQVDVTDPASRIMVSQGPLVQRQASVEPAFGITKTTKPATPTPRRVCTQTPRRFSGADRSWPPPCGRSAGDARGVPVS